MSVHQYVGSVCEIALTTFESLAALSLFFVLLQGCENLLITYVANNPPNPRAENYRFQ